MDHDNGLIVLHSPDQKIYVIEDDNNYMLTGGCWCVLLVQDGGEEPRPVYLQAKHLHRMTFENASILKS